MNMQRDRTRSDAAKARTVSRRVRRREKSAALFLVRAFYL